MPGIVQSTETRALGKIVKNSYSSTEHINFKANGLCLADLDLWLSVGNASNCTVTVTKTGKKKWWFSSQYAYKIKVELSDTYDFDKFEPSEKGRLLSAINNYLGYYPMEWGMLKSYNWRISFEFTQYY